MSKWNSVGWIPWLGCNYQWLQAVEMKQRRSEGQKCCPVPQEVDWVWRVASEEQPWAGWKPVGKNQRLRPQREIHGWCVLQAPDQGEWTYWLTASCPAGGLSHPRICWERGTASCRQHEKLLECRGDDFLSNVIVNITSGDAILDLMATNVDKLIEVTKTGVSLCCSDHLLEFAVLRDMGQVRNKVRPLNFREKKLPLLQGGSQRDSLGDCCQGQGKKTELADL